MYRLLFENPEVDRAPFTTRGALLLIGSGPRAMLRLTAPGIVDRHALIELRHGSYYVCDVSESGGVRVNGHVVRETRLVAGDLIELVTVKLRFEPVSETPRRRWVMDPVQWVAAVGVGVIIVGQVIALVRAAAEPRPPGMKVDGSRTIYLPNMKPPAVTVLTPPAPPPVPATPVVLNRMLRIQSIKRRDTRDGAEMTIQVQAQVSERVFDVAAATVQVEWRIAGVAPQTVTLPLPAKWGNFSARTFVVRYPGNAAAVQGCLVRSYYRGQLQDQRMEPSVN
jgi:pSer/pThr/pTyr-binding forkhead associated (FHA) protein